MTALRIRTPELRTSHRRRSCLIGGSDVTDCWLCWSL